MDAFERLVANLDYPMYIVTTRAADGEPLGCLVGFTTQASIHPPRFVICLSHNNHTYRRGRDAPVLAVHAVPADADDLAQLFGGETGDKIDKFARTPWHEGPEGVPVLERCHNWFAARVLWRRDGGDHDAYLVEPFAGEADEEREFTFHRAKRIEPGHEA